MSAKNTKCSSNTRTKYFYVYYSYEPWGRGYIGKRECWCLPEDDIKYFGSFEDKTFKPTEKIILETFNSRKDAYVAEAKLHTFYDVKNNLHFSNKTNQYLNKNELFKIKKLRISDENFQNQFISYVKEFKSIRQILLKLELKETGGNYNSVKTWIELLKLDTSHFTGMGWSKGKKLGDRLTEKQKEKSHYKYTYTVTTPTEQIIITKNLSQFCREHNLNKRNMWLASVGRIKSCKGYKVTREPLNNQKTNVL